jgi:hypothetical protein
MIVFMMCLLLLLSEHAWPAVIVAEPRNAGNQADAVNHAGILLPVASIHKKHRLCCIYWLPMTKFLHIPANVFIARCPAIASILNRAGKLQIFPFLLKSNGLSLFYGCGTRAAYASAIAAIKHRYSNSQAVPA